jgi:hypothetical protein
MNGPPQIKDKNLIDGPGKRDDSRAWCAAQVVAPPPPPKDLKKAKEDAEARSLLPKFPELDPGIFHDYVEYGKRVSWALEEFHFAAILALASMALKRKVIIEAGVAKFYTNIFAMIVGQTTISGKSTACKMAINAFEKSVIYEEPIAKFNSTKIIRGTRSEPALVQDFNDVYNHIWYYDDCSGFFDDLPSWNAHIIGTLCTAYDGEPLERGLSTPKKVKKEEDKNQWNCPFPFLSLLFNMTEHDMMRIANDRLYSNGFFPRFMWFYGQGGTPRKNVKLTLEDKQTISRIALQIKNLRSALGKVPNNGIVIELCDIIEEWQINSIMSRLGKKDELYRVAIGRGFAHAYKIATILAMFDPDFQEKILNQEEYPIEVSIPEKHARMAIKIVDQYLIPRMVYVQSACAATDPRNPQTKVLNAITQAGGHITRTELIRATRLNKNDLKAALDSLQESEEIELVVDKETNPKNPTTTIIKS